MRWGATKVVFGALLVGGVLSPLAAASALRVSSVPAVDGTGTTMPGMPTGGMPPSATTTTTTIAPTRTAPTMPPAPTGTTTTTVAETHLAPAPSAPTQSATTTLAPTSMLAPTTQTTLSRSATTTTLAAAHLAPTSGGSTTGGSSTGGSTGGSSTGATTTLAPTSILAPTMPGVTTAGSPTTLASTTGGATAITTPTVPTATGAATATTMPQVVPSDPVFFGTTKAPVDFFAIRFGAAAGTTVRGAPVRGNVAGLNPGSTIRAVLRSEPIVLAEFDVADDGTAAFEVTIPEDIEPGDHTLTFEGTSADGTPVSSVTVFSVSSTGVTQSVVESAEIVGTTLDTSAIERSVEAELPVYDTERNLSRTTAIAATAVVVSSLASMAVTQAASGMAGGLGANLGGGPVAPTAPRTGSSGGGTSTTTRSGSSGSGSSGGSGSTGSGSSDGAPAGRREDQGADGQNLDDQNLEDQELGDQDDGASSDGGDDGEEAEISGTDANMLELDEEDAGRSDRRGLWVLPGYAVFDRFLRRAVPRTSPRSVLLTRILQDGHWFRVATGVVSPVMWLVGLVLGVASALGLPGVVTVPATGVTFTVVFLSLLDAMTGASAWAGFTITALATGNLTTVFDLRTVLGLGVLFVALPSIGSNIRPFGRHAAPGSVSLIDRAGDYVVMPVLLAYAASAAYSALNGLSGLEMVSSSDAGTLFAVVTAGAYVRLLGEDAALKWYPSRHMAIQVPLGESQSAAARTGTVVLGAGLYLLAAAPFFGLGWRTWLTVGLVSLVPLLGLAADRFPNVRLLHKWFPRGLLRFVVMLFVSAWFGKFVLSVAGSSADARSTAVFMLLPGVVVGLIDLVAREGGDWKESRLKHVGGLAVWLLAVAVLSGRVTL